MALGQTNAIGRHWLALHLVGLGLLLAAATPASAATPRFGIEAGSGVLAGPWSNGQVSPLAQVVVSYRLEAFDDHWEPFIGFAPAFGGPVNESPMTFTVGTRYLLPSWGPIDPFISGMLGVFYAPPIRSDGISMPVPGMTVPLPWLGIGAHWMPLDHWGMVADLHMTLPLIFRFTLGVRSAW